MTDNKNPSLTQLNSAGRGAVDNGQLGRILVHMCCGPCSIYPIKAILGKKAHVAGFFHNPNIHPLSEFKKRLDAVKTLAGYLSIELICDEIYRPSVFIRGTREASSTGRRPPKEERCSYCYASRIEETAKTAVKHGFDAFSSSLLYSRYQNHEEIKKIGAALSARYGIPFFYDDFRAGWQEGIDSSRSMGLYRQKYCGCIYSKMERYSNRMLKNKGFVQAAQKAPDPCSAWVPRRRQGARNEA